MDQNSASMPSLMNYLFKKFYINIKTIVPYNHQSLQAEHGIKSLFTILNKHLTDLGQMWSKYLPLTTLAFNTFNSPHLANYSLHELTFLVLDIKVSPTYKYYSILLNKRLKYLHKLLQDFKLKG